MKIVNVRIKYGGQIMAYDCGDQEPALGDWVVAVSGETTYLGQVVTSPVIWPSLDQPGCCQSMASRDHQPPENTMVPDGINEAERPACSLTQEDYQQAEPNPEHNQNQNPPVPDPLAETGASFDEAEKGSDRLRSKQKSTRRSMGTKAAKTPPRRLLRLATPADMNRQVENEMKEREAFEYCLARVTAQRLEMKLVAVEVIFDGSKTIFYYTAEERVDFRLLVKELVSRFRTRIEMRQIGVRHEARMIGGLGGCGRGFCCCGFLSNFVPVSVKMAKEQNVSLSPTKISGVCGRLMCCLAFEHYDKAPLDSGEFEDEALLGN